MTDGFPRSRRLPEGPVGVWVTVDRRVRKMGIGTNFRPASDNLRGDGSLSPFLIPLPRPLE